MMLSVIVVTHNVRAQLRNCLESVFAGKTPWPLEVFVVDSGLDGSAGMVRETYPQVRVLEAPENPGFSSANNLALRHARGRYCLLLNPDTVVPPDALVRTVQAMEDDPSIGILGPKLIRGNGQLDLACRRSFPTVRNAAFHFLRLPKLFPQSRRFGEYNLTFRDPDLACDVDAVAGSFMLIRREVLDQLGLLDETFWMYGEDLDFCWRAKERGWRTRYFPSVCVVHLKGESSKARSLRCTYEFFRAMHLFYRKHYAPANGAPTNLLVTTGIWVIGAASLAADRLRPAMLRRVS
jgi:N-acetylglucosaminyl-diphospho-decaprenol L-rhamnosyltransferase